MHIWNRFQRSVIATRERLLDPDALDQTLRRLSSEGALSDRAAAEIRPLLRPQIDASRYIVGHLGAHLAVGAVFAFDIIPLPLGTISRILWVVGNRIREAAHGRRRQAKVHSIGVLLVAAIPLVGYAAYLLPLRKNSAELTFVLANHAWILRTGCSYETFLKNGCAPISWLARRLVPHP